MFHVKHWSRSLRGGSRHGQKLVRLPGNRWTPRALSDSLTCVPTPSLAALPIRRLTPRDLAACADLSEDRGWPREEHKWGLLLAAGKGYGIDDPDGGLVSRLRRDRVRTAGAPDLAAIGMVLVAERHARQGIGRRLMQSCRRRDRAPPR